MQENTIRLFNLNTARRSIIRTAHFFPFLVLALMLFSLPTNAQKRDNLTPHEDEIVRQVQEADKRMEIYSKIIDRRFLALDGKSQPQSKKAEKESEMWGALREGTRVELLSDIERTLQEAINKINDIAERDAKNPLFPKAVRTLSESCTRWIAQLKVMQGSASEEREKALLASTIDLANQVVEASANVPKEEKKKKKT